MVKIRELCFGGDIAKYKYQGINTYFTEASLIAESEVALARTRMPWGNMCLTFHRLSTSPPTRGDPVSYTDALVSFTVMPSITRVVYFQDELSDHATTLLTTVPYVLFW